MNKWITVVLLGLLSATSWAEQFKTVKDVEVHYSAFNSTFLTPQVARSYQLKRNSYNAILNISVLDRSQPGKPSIEAKLSGYARNLIGNSRNLTFREVKEGDAIYYLAEVPISNEENITFKVDVDAGIKGADTLTFSQKFYVDE
ncbi:DUF4426 domain-containing protein [Vibrio sp.]|uniref:DUF4426 domain-containing protein n=1 Tax=Vibrio sp. TaxID=678 RepID=UPI003D0F82BB